MALVVNDRVKETSTTTGTGTFDLGGAVSGFESFVTAIGNGNTTYYSIVNENGEFEVGLGTVTDAATDTLSRDTILSSSNSDAAVNFSAGTKNVFCTLPASKAVILDSSGNIVANNGSNLTDLNATNVASGTLSADRLPTVPTTKGGTGLTTIGTANQVLAVNTGATALEYTDTLTNKTLDDATVTTGLNFGNLIKANFGDSDELQIFSNSSQAKSFLKTDTNILSLTSNNKVIMATSGSQVAFENDIDGATNLYYNLVKKFETTNTGVTVTGTASATTFSGSGASLTDLNATNISSGTLASDRLPTVPTTKGGTGLTTIGTANQVLAVNGAGTALEYQTISADITGVIAGNGLTGGGTTGEVTLNVGAGALIDVTADAIDVDLSELTTSTSDADGDFFVVVDSANAQKKLTKANIAISGFNNDSGFIDGSSLNASNLSSGTVPDARFPATLPAISGANLTNLDASDLASGTVPIARIDLNLLTTSTSDGDGDFFVVVDSVGAEKKLTKANINISGFNNDAGYSTTTGTVTSVGVTAGAGLTGGGTVTTSGTINLDVGAGTGIDVAADAISVDVSDFMTNGANNRVLTATGTDAMNAEANLTYSGTEFFCSVGTNLNASIVQLSHDTAADDGVGITLSRTTSDSDLAAIGVLEVDELSMMSREGMNFYTGGGSTYNATILRARIDSSGHFVPGANDTYDLGASGNVWRNIYTGDLHLSNEAKEEGNAVDGTKGNWTIQEGAEHLYILNNKSGKKYRFKLEEM